MQKRSNHVVPSNKRGGWMVKKSGSLRASRSFKRKSDAVDYGRVLSRKEKTELYIHKKNGTIQDRNTYHSDPYLPKG
ncbi:MAG: DUF2188 domain-containing protein [Marinirhabdus sp.]